MNKLATDNIFDGFKEVRKDHIPANIDTVGAKIRETAIGNLR